MTDDIDSQGRLVEAGAKLFGDVRPPERGLVILVVEGLAGRAEVPARPVADIERVGILVDL